MDLKALVSVGQPKLKFQHFRVTTKDMTQSINHQWLWELTRTSLIHKVGFHIYSLSLQWRDFILVQNTVLALNPYHTHKSAATLLARATKFTDQSVEKATLQSPKYGLFPTLFSQEAQICPKPLGFIFQCKIFCYSNHGKIWKFNLVLILGGIYDICSHRTFSGIRYEIRLFNCCGWKKRKSRIVYNLTVFFWARSFFYKIQWLVWGAATTLIKRAGTTKETNWLAVFTGELQIWLSICTSCIWAPFLRWTCIFPVLEG